MLLDLYRVAAAVLFEAMADPIYAGIDALAQQHLRALDT